MLQRKNATGVVNHRRRILIEDLKLEMAHLYQNLTVVVLETAIMCYINIHNVAY